MTTGTIEPGGKLAAVGDVSTFADKTLQNQSVELINDAMASLCEDLIDFGTSKSLSRSEGSSL